MGDWLDDLADFAAVYVAEACKEWRQVETRRPTPADIRRLAAEAKQRAERNRQPKLAPQMPPPRPDRDMVRPHWRSLPISEQTAAETAIWMREFEAKVQASGLSISAYFRREFAPKRSAVPASTDTRWQTAKINEAELQELLARMPIA